MKFKIDKINPDFIKTDLKQRKKVTNKRQNRLIENRFFKA